VVWRGCQAVWSSGLGERDGVAECFAPADLASDLALAVFAAVVVTGAEVAAAGGGVAEQGPDDDEDRSGYGYQEP
jgi:hypothetical protein